MIKNKGITVIDFWSQHCEPCERVNQFLPELRKTFPDIALFKIDISNPNNSQRVKEIIAQNNVKIVPRLTIYKDGNVVDNIRAKGAISKRRIINAIRKHHEQF